jgi:hypothetical protein
VQKKKLKQQKKNPERQDMSLKKLKLWLKSKLKMLKLLNKKMLTHIKLLLNSETRVLILKKLKELKLKRIKNNLRFSINLKSFKI